MVNTDRLRELVTRLVASGPKAAHVSASECHEITDGVLELLEERDRTAMTVTDDQIRVLFAEHCECRPINTARISHWHDCDTGYTDVCRLALHGFATELDDPERSG